MLKKDFKESVSEYAKLHKSQINRHYSFIRNFVICIGYKKFVTYSFNFVTFYKKLFLILR